MIIAIDTALVHATVAVADVENDRVVFAEAGETPRSHAEDIGPLLRAAVDVAGEGLAGVLVGRGPGSFAGLRVGLAAARTLAWARDVHLVGVCTLDVLAAAGSLRDGPFDGFVVTDARRSQMYWAQYVSGRRVAGPGVESRAQALARTAGSNVLGDVDLLTSTDRRESGTTVVPSEVLGRCAIDRFRAGPGSGAVSGVSSSGPYYLRPPDIHGSPLGARPEDRPEARSEARSVVRPEVRPAEAADIDAIHGIEQLRHGATAWSRQQIVDEITAYPESRWYIVAVMNDVVVGYLGLMISGGDADVQTVTVSGEAERQGIGSLLMQAAVDHMLRIKGNRIFLEVRADNDAALALYRKFGFERLGVRRRYYGDGADAVNMRLRLGRTRLEEVADD